MSSSKHSKSKLTLLVLFSFLYILSGCIGSETDKGFNEANQLYNLINKHTDCELVEILDYSSENGKRKTATFKLVGCPINDFEREADRINKVFKDSVDYFCNIKLVTYKFINKQNSNTVKYYNCNKL